MSISLYPNTVRPLLNHMATLPSFHFSNLYLGPLYVPSLEENELLASRSKDLMRLHLQHIKAYCLGNRPALTNSDDVSFLDASEGG